MIDREFIKSHALPLSIGVISTLAAALSTVANPILRFDRSAIQHGEVWRLFSGNFVHLGWSHLLLNLAGLAVIWMLYHRLLSLRSWLLVVVVSSLAVGVGLWLLNPQLEWYVGLSGSLHGLFFAGAITSLAAGYRAEWLLLVVMFGKLLWEQFVGPTPGTADLAGGPVIVDAHLYGAIAGIVCGVFFYRAHRQAARAQSKE